VSTIARDLDLVPNFFGTHDLVALRYSEPSGCDGAHSMAQGLAGGSYESAVIGDRFQLGHPPTILARTASVSPIGFSRLKSACAPHGRTKDVPAENAYLFHVQLQPASVDMWIDGKRRPATTKTSGTTFLYDLRDNPVAEIYSSFDNIRFYISQPSLDELAFDQGIRRTKGLAAPSLGFHDRIMYGLANALLDPVERANERSTLFIDHVALAFFAHVIRTYGDAPVPDASTSGALSPWQVRRVLDFLAAHLSEDPTVAELARECGLSSGYFARAFRQTTGVTPHQWLIKKGLNELGVCCSETGSGWRTLLWCAASSTKATSRGFLRSSKVNPPEGGGG
jgi:hypothetical protein